MRILPAAIAAIALCGGPFAATAGAQQTGGNAQVVEAERMIEAGDLTGAVAALQRLVAANPSSFDARLAFGRALDLQARHAEARRHFEEAIKLAKDDDTRASALTALGISYAFERKADEAARYYQRAFDADVQANDRAAAAARANALGRIYLESGNLQKAEQWYTTGYEMARKIPELPPAQAALWEMRRHNAFGRIAARKGDRKAAKQHAAEVKTLLDKIENANQGAFYPYLVGYIAFYGRQYRAAIAELQRGDQGDPFVLGLIAQSYEKLGDRPKAEEFYRKVLASPAHSINSAFARPLARAYLR